MSAKLDRREFMQKAGVTVLGAASAMILTQSTMAERQNNNVAQSREQSLERWLLETGQHTLDKDIYSIAARHV